MKKILAIPGSLSCLLLLLVSFSLSASAQNLEFNGGYAHVSGDQGLDGFNVGAALWFTPDVSIAADYDRVVDTSRIGIFELTKTGLIVAKSRLQNFLFGPRIYFPNTIKSENKHLANLRPFAEAQLVFLISMQALEDQTANVDQSASDKAFSWMLGAGPTIAYRRSGWAVSNSIYCALT